MHLRCPFASALVVGAAAAIPFGAIVSASASALPFLPAAALAAVFRVLGCLRFQIINCSVPRIGRHSRSSEVLRHALLLFCADAQVLALASGVVVEFDAVPALLLKPQGSTFRDLAEGAGLVITT